MKQKIVPIVFCFDNNLTAAACISISSLLMNAKPNTFYDVFILHSRNESLDHREISRLPHYYKNCKIRFRALDDEFENAFEIRGITTPAYYRLLIPEIIPEYDKILYSDVDVIFRNDLSDIYFNTDMQGYYLAGVDSLANFQIELVKYYENKLGIEANGIIYSGNLIFNSALLRKDGVMETFKQLAKNDYIFQDMDILNLACRGKIKYLPPSFCLTTYISEYSIYRKEELGQVWSQAELDEAFQFGIVHYNGKKPWIDVCINFDIWWEYYRRSPFFDQKRYFDFFNYKLTELDRLPLWRRVKILLRYFIHRK